MPISAFSGAQSEPARLSPPPKGSRILVAMSGGVDSAVSALLLREAGYDVVGVNLRMWEQETQETCGRSCCSPEDIQDARSVGMQIDIPFYVLRMETLFRKRVIERFILDYTTARTANPCVECNTHVKFGALFEKARDLGIDCIATGHYADVGKLSNGRLAILPGKDIRKNQAYYLYGLSQEALSRTIFPLARLTKPEVREIARSHGLSVAEKQESQEICFIPDNNYRAFLERQNIPFTPGFFRDNRGGILGRHDGRERFTVGQRKGLGLSSREPLYVLRIEESGDVVLGPVAETFCSSFRVEQIHLMGLSPEELHAPPVDCRVQIRYRSPPIPARVSLEKESRQIAWNGEEEGLILRVELSDPASSVTPGQSAVFFPPEEKGEPVLMGGIISR